MPAAGEIRERFHSRRGFETRENPRFEDSKPGKLLGLRLLGEVAHGTLRAADEIRKARQRTTRWTVRDCPDVPDGARSGEPKEEYSGTADS